MTAPSMVPDLVAPEDEAARTTSLAAVPESSPALTIDLTEGVADRRSAETVDQWTRRVCAGLPPDLEAVVASCLHGLSLDATHLLELAAVMGSSFSLMDAAEVVGVPVGRLLAPLREVLDAGLLVPAGAALAFEDECVREAVYSSVAEPVRMALHRQIGGLLLDRGQSAGSAAAHLIAGARPGDRPAIAGLERAAREALRSSPGSAAALALKALELTDQADDERLSLTVTAVEALVSARRVGEAAELAGAALAGRASPTIPAARLRLTLASILFMEGRSHEAVHQADCVLAERGLDEDLYTAAEVVRLFAFLAQRDFLHARETAEAVLAGGERTGGHSSLAAALGALSFMAWEEGRVADALCLARAGVRRGDREPPEGRHTYPRLGLAVILTTLGDFTAADAMIAAAEQEIEALADTLWAAAPPIFRAHLHLARGRLSEALADAEAGLARAEALGTRFFVPMALGVLASVALLKGDFASAAAYIERSRGEPPSGRVFFGLARAAWTEARLADARGDGDRARELLAQICDDLPACKRLLVKEPAAAAWLVRAALDAGDPPRAEAVVTCAEHLAADNRQFPPVAAAAAQARGVLRRDAPVLEEAAVAHLQPWAKASAFEDAGVVLAEAGNAEEAGARLSRALVGYDEAGAGRDAARVRARLRKLGIRRRHWVRSERPMWGWDSLTETERRVAELVAEGLTNHQVSQRMFLSRHTIDFHLRQIFRKLGIATRVELTRLVLERARPSAG